MSVCSACALYAFQFAELSLLDSSSASSYFLLLLQSPYPYYYYYYYYRLHCEINFRFAALAPYIQMSVCSDCALYAFQFATLSLVHSSSSSSYLSSSSSEPLSLYTTTTDCIVKLILDLQRLRSIYKCQCAALALCMHFGLQRFRF